MLASDAADPPASACPLFLLPVSSLVDSGLRRSSSRRGRAGWGSDSTDPTDQKGAVMHFNPYLSFNGNCAEAFKFYEQVFNGKIDAMMTYGEIPEGAGPPVDAEAKNRIMHAHMTIGDTILMGADSPPEYYQKPQGTSVSINVTDTAEAERIYHALEDGAQITMPLQETFWAPRFGMLVDRFGTPWMINCGSTK
jgi:PhnB protein